jgi:type VI secretion system protein ImpA
VWFSCRERRKPRARPWPPPQSWISRSWWPPLPGDKPAGVNLREDVTPTSVYHAVRDARSANRAAERQLLAGVSDGPPPDWRPVLQRGTAVLAQNAKDLEIAAYVIEALVRLHGFAGLRDGFRLARELAERFWDGLHPLPDEDGLETRLAPLTGLNGEDGEGTLISPILSVPLTEAGNHPAFACYHVQQAVAAQQLADEAARAKRLQELPATLEVIGQAVAETSRAFYAALVQDLNECQEEFARLVQVLDEKCGSKSPPASNIRTALAACREALQQVAADKLPVPEPEDAPGEETKPTNGAATAGPAEANRPLAGAALSGDAIMSRDEAFCLLLKVAEHFRRTEPQSVVSYGLEQVVRWGRMSLPELLRELISEDGPREQCFKQLGIRQAPAAAAADAQAAPAEQAAPPRNKWAPRN